MKKMFILMVISVLLVNNACAENNNNAQQQQQQKPDATVSRMQSAKDTVQKWVNSIDTKKAQEFVTKNRNYIGAAAVGTVFVVVALKKCSWLRKKLGLEKEEQDRLEELFNY